MYWTNFFYVTERGRKKLCCLLHSLLHLWDPSSFPAFCPPRPLAPASPQALLSSPVLNQSHRRSKKKKKKGGTKYL